MTRALVFLAAFALFLRALHPGYKLDDSPETVAACVTLGVQHPPGFPLHTLAGRLACALPVGSPYFRVNLLAAACGAGCCAALGPAGGLALAGTTLFRETAVAAKGGLYTLTLLLLLAGLLGAVRSPRSVAPWLFAGLGGAVHWMTVICWLPALGWLAGRWTTRRALLAAGILALGLSPYLALPLREGAGVVFGDPARAGGFLDILLRRDLLAPVTAKPPALAGIQALWNLFVPLREGGLWFLLLAVPGALALRRRDRRLALALAGGTAGTILAVAAIANPIHGRTGELVLWFTAPFLLPVLAAAAACAGAAPDLAGDRRAPARTVLLAAVTTVILLNGAGRFLPTDHSHDYLGHDFGRNMTAGLPPGAVLLTEMEFNGLPALAARYVDGSALTVVVTNPFLTRDWGWRRLARTLPAADPIAARPEPPDLRVVALADALLATGPAWTTLTTVFPALKPRLRPAGLLQRVLPAGTAVDRPAAPEVERVLRRFTLRGLFSDPLVRDRLTRGVLDGYLAWAVWPAERDRMAGRLPAVITGYRRALRFPGLFVRAATLRDLGIAQALSGDDAGALDSFLAAAAITPGNPELWKNIAVARRHLHRP